MERLVLELCHERLLALSEPTLKHLLRLPQPLSDRSLDLLLFCGHGCALLVRPRSCRGCLLPWQLRDLLGALPSVGARHVKLGWWQRTLQGVDQSPLLYFPAAVYAVLVKQEVPEHRPGGEVCELPCLGWAKDLEARWRIARRVCDDELLELLEATGRGANVMAAVCSIGAPHGRQHMGHDSLEHRRLQRAEAQGPRLLEAERVEIQHYIAPRGIGIRLLQAQVLSQCGRVHRSRRKPHPLHVDAAQGQREAGA
mmetsp:Transcript_89341/g.251546  ORF Transcript_89341/g.251546 Transcript_89341/m.251546 type:complete len:254 (-) Transcript_89341:402-1163(-)